jgi:Domain of unknown function (DUF4145)
MEIVARCSTQTNIVKDERTGAQWETSKIHELLVCPACEGVTLRAYFWADDLESEGDVRFDILYPSETRLPPGLPSVVHKAFLSALKVKPIDANGFGVLIGRVIEQVCVDRGASGKFLSDKLEDLAKRGEIPRNLVSVAEQLRELRNVGAHVDWAS